MPRVTPHRARAPCCMPGGSRELMAQVARGAWHAAMPCRNLNTRCSIHRWQTCLRRPRLTDARRVLAVVWRICDSSGMADMTWTSYTDGVCVRTGLLCLATCRRFFPRPCSVRALYASRCGGATREGGRAGGPAGGGGWASKKQKSWGASCTATLGQPDLHQL